MITLNAARPLDKGMGEAVARRTVFRASDHGSMQRVAERVAEGNTSLTTVLKNEERSRLAGSIASGALITSGRHLQHGDASQPGRPMEVMTNCLDGSTSIATMEYGPIRIDAIAGQTVTVIAGDGVLRPAVINVHGEREVFDFTFRSVSGGGGKFRHVVRATKDHRWKLRDGSITQSLSVGDVVVSANANPLKTIDDTAVIHGVVYGDGSAHKGRRDHARPGVSQGRTYASIRVCKQDAVRDEIQRRLDAAGYTYSTPEYADGDRVYYIGKFAHAKDLPHTHDPEYIAGFIQGWWLADGSKTVESGIEISTCSAEAAQWLRSHAVYAGFSVTMHRVFERRPGDGSFANGKPLNVIRLRRGVEWKVDSITDAGTAMTYCPEEPVTSLFALSNGLLTGNCSTSAASFAEFYLLLNGSGVGGSYDDDLRPVDWHKAPSLRIAISRRHPDFPTTDKQLFQFGKDYGLLPYDQNIDDADLGAVSDWIDLHFVDEDDICADWNVNAPNSIWFDDGKGGWIKPSVTSIHTHSFEREGETYHRVGDSREGWAKALELYESMAHAKRHNEVLVLGFSDVRPCGAPIAGMQDRPASGPMSLMRAFHNINQHVARGENAEMPLWMQAMFVDHYLSVEVQVGGARRAARMATKSWTDPGIFDFIRIKADNGLWTSNNSVMVDKEFWQRVENVRKRLKLGANLESDFCHLDYQAYRVFEDVTHYSYINGEPGLINGDKLEDYRTGSARKKPVYKNGEDFGSKRYRATYAKGLLAEVAAAAAKTRFPTIVNPCGEIPLSVTGGYCVIGDAAPVLAATRDLAANGMSPLVDILSDSEITDWDTRAEEAVRLDARFLMRVNLMDSLYGAEVKRTNRIGVSLTGIHEWAWARFGLTFKDTCRLTPASEPFWRAVEHLSQAAKSEANAYAKELGLERPVTVTTIKPAGTTSKLYGLTEGAHLPARRQYLRWVQFRGKKVNGQWAPDADPLLAEYEAKGYPIRELVTFPGMSIVGFPTIPLLSRLMPPSEIVTAPEATPEEQYAWISLLERFWLGEEQGAQISYTLKVFTDKYNIDEYRDIVMKNQPNVRCCSVLPSKPDSEMGYEYLPETEVSVDVFASILEGIDDGDLHQDIDIETLQCATGACPI